MKIFIEGNDLTRKSTVAEKLKQKLGYEIVKGSSFQLATGSVGDMYNYLNNILISEKNLIVDRFIFSNIVYATAFPKYTILETDMFEELDKKMSEDENILVVYLYASTDELIKRLGDRGDDMIVSADLENINNLYDAIWTYTYVEPLMINTEYITSDEITEIILNHLKNRR